MENVLAHSRPECLHVHHGTLCSKCGPPLDDTFADAVVRLSGVSGEEIRIERQKAEELLSRRRKGALIQLGILVGVGAAALAWGWHSSALASGPAIFGYGLFFVLFLMMAYFGFELHAQWPKRTPCIAFFLGKGVEPGGANSDAGGGAIRYVDVLYRTLDHTLRMTRIPHLEDWEIAAPGWRITLMVHRDRPNNWILVDSAEGEFFAR